MHKIASWLEETVCSGCSWNTPQQQNNKTADPQIVFSPQLTSNGVRPLLELASDVSSASRYHYVDEIVTKLSDGSLDARETVRAYRERECRRRRVLIA